MWRTSGEACRIQRDKAGIKTKASMGKIQICAKEKKTKCAKQIVANKSGLSVDHIIYELEKEKLQTVLKEAKLHYEEKLVDQINVNDKRFWNYTRHFTKSLATISNLNFEAKANILNNYFIYVLTDEQELLHSLPTLDTIVKCTLYNLEVRTQLTKLKPDKASGPDLLNVNIFRNCLDFDIHIAYIFNKSVQTSQIPQDWRDANITPIHKKKGPRNKCNNYRPVSLTSQVIKLLERIIQDSLLKLADTNNTISCDQHGLQKKCHALVDEHCWTLDKPMASLSTCHLGLWLGWQILLNLVKLPRYSTIKSR